MVNKKEGSVLPLVSICIPVLNEAGNIEALYKRLCSLATRMTGQCRLEFVFSDNHSSDETWGQLKILAEKDARVRAVRFAKNVGFQRSILANFMHAQGDAVMQIDADLQDPPEMLEQFFGEWVRGYHVVYGVRRKRRENVFISHFRRLGYWFIDMVSEHPIPRDVGDFRLVDRKVITALCKMKTPSPYLRGMIAGLGFSQTGIVYDREARVAGESKFGLSRLIRLGLTAVFNHSSVPLRFATLAGLVMLGVSVLGSFYYLVLRALHPELPQGLASIHILVLFSTGLQSLLLGMIGEYLLRIYLILRAEPVAIVEQSLNFSQDELKL
ncbi:glycosyltransferase family 2 protein [Stutzerimonas azotifigens]|uniref:Glycosyltransferase family 2 protein n=1 Tax=Stutzerimonas azotifigens TaxID=291995 RepID=A0ABR5Z4T8_9GAMM|nr:glycosyltransferase family 2 protein [Stutzerimonas azotifigens]MBA1275232.1 glycosyltransferase family 2 protein [Stutzerimonas azotifigens]